MRTQSGSRWALIIVGILAIYGHQEDHLAGARVIQGSGKHEKIVLPLRLYIKFIDPTEKSKAFFDYYANVKIASQPFRALFDTTIDEIWFPHHDGRNENLHHEIDRERQGFIPLEGQEDFGKNQLQYRRVTLDGIIYEDKFKLVSTNRQFKQKFLAVTEANDSKFKVRRFDAVIGLPAVAYGDPKTKKLQLINILNSLYPGESDGRLGLDHHLRFSIWFDNKFDVNKLNKEQNGGELTIGGYNPKRAGGEIGLHHTLGSTWTFNLTSIWWGKYSVSSQPRKAHIDTGIYIILGPEDEVKTHLKDIRATYDSTAKMWTVNCNKYRGLDELTFVFDDTEYKLKPEYYITEIVHPKKGKFCYSNMVGVPNQDDWILGTSFLRAFYMEFDAFYGEIGIAPTSKLN